MSALRSTTEIQTELDFGQTKPGTADHEAADAFMRLASHEDHAVPSPVMIMQADLEASLAALSDPGRLPVGWVMLALTGVGAVMWWGIIAGVSALARG